MPKITLDLEDDEFLELGALGFAVDTWNTDPSVNAFGRLALKIKERVQKRATPGQILYLNKVVTAIKEAAMLNTVNIENATDSFRTLIHEAGNLMEASDTIDKALNDDE